MDSMAAALAEWRSQARWSREYYPTERARHVQDASARTAFRWRDRLRRLPKQRKPSRCQLVAGGWASGGRLTRRGAVDRGCEARPPYAGALFPGRIWDGPTVVGAARSAPTWPYAGGYAGRDGFGPGASPHR